MNRKKILIAVGAVVIIAVFVTISIINKNREKPIEVPAYKVELKDFIREVSANGDISSKEYAKIYAAVSASVESVAAEEGDIVQKDQIIIRLDQESLENNLINAENAVTNIKMSVRAELLNLRSAYSNALTAFAQTEREWNRKSELYKIGSVSDEELKLVQEQLVIAEENLDSSLQKLNFREGRELDDDRSGTWLSDTEIVNRSPEVIKALSDYDINLKTLKYYEIKSKTAGTLTALNVDNNSVVEPGMLMAEIHDEEQLIVEAMIDEVDLSYIKTGQDVIITSDSFIGTEISGKVSEIAPIIRKVGDSRVCAIEVEILENPDNVARIGASASIFITVETRLQKPAIPVEAYFIEDNRKIIFVLKPSDDQDIDQPEYYTAERREIETGILDIEHIEVTEGLAEGDLVLIGRIPGVEDGSEVKVIENGKDNTENKEE